MGLSRENIQKILEESAGQTCLAEKSGDQPYFKLEGIADMPNRFGFFQVAAFSTSDGAEHAAFIYGDIYGKENIPVRIHSGCPIGEVFASPRCKCLEDLETAVDIILDKRMGILLFLYREGNGSLGNLVKKYQAQDEGEIIKDPHETSDEKEQERKKSIACQMLKTLQVSSIRIISNNPREALELTGFALNIRNRIPLEKPAKGKKDSRERKSGLFPEGGPDLSSVIP